MSLAVAGITGFLWINQIAQTSFMNKVDNLNQARNVIERIGRDVRMARNVGDIAGNTADVLTDVDLGSGLTATIGSPVFPGSNNALYYGKTPTGGGWHKALPAGGFALASDLLIVQQPVFVDDINYKLWNAASANYYPTSYDRAAPNTIIDYAATPSQNIDDNMDTLIYFTEADPENPGEYLMKVAGYRGVKSSLGVDKFGPAMSASALQAVPPQVILKGITGPFTDGTKTKLNVFQYLDRTYPNGAGLPLMPTQVDNLLATGAIANITGVIINLELKNNSNTSDANLSTQGFGSTVGLKSEVYMRNNRLATKTGIQNGDDVDSDEDDEDADDYD
jgi:hypothetical protein